MCGILGSVNLDFDSSSLDLLRHRGPDDEGLIRFGVGTHKLIFGHRRLAIVDLSPAGHQPMFDRENMHGLIFNGELYNHFDIRRSLRQREFKGHSDTETLLYAIRDLGLNALTQLNGIFAFAYVDQTAKKLQLVRDPFGVKPLYYVINERYCAFSSEMRTLIPLVGAEIDHEAISIALRLRYCPAPWTIFRGIRKLAPGHLVSIDLSHSHLKWAETAYAACPPEVRSVAFKEAVHEYGRLFQQAVARQLMSDVEVGILLSGGIDSALVAEAARGKPELSRRLKAFTVGFAEDSEADEIAEAARTAQLLNMDHHVVRISKDDFLNALPQCADIVEEPLATTSIVPMYFLAKEAGENVKVVLSGQGADEPLGGYRKYQVQALREHGVARVAARVGRALNSLGGAREFAQAVDALAAPNDIDSFLVSYSVFDETEIAELTGAMDTNSAALIARNIDRLQLQRYRSPAQRMMALDLRMNLADDLLLYTDKLTMHFSLECRVPMLDLELVRFIESLPIEMRIRLRKSKIIHKKYAKGVLPGDVVRRRKKAFSSPTRTWFRDSVMLRERLLASDGTFLRYFDKKTIERLIVAHSRGENLEKKLFLLFCLRCIMDKWDKSTTQASLSPVVAQ